MKNKQTNVGSFATAKLQAKRRSLLAIVALAAVIVFSMIACDDGVGGPGGGGGGGGSSTLTITGLPRGNWGVSVFPAGTDLSTNRAISNANNSRKDEAGATGAYQNNNVFSLNYFGWQPSRGPYKESGRKEVLLASFDDTYWYYATVNFSNGSATVPFSSFRQVY